MSEVNQTLFIKNFIIYGTYMNEDFLKIDEINVDVACVGKNDKFDSEKDCKDGN